MHRIRLVPSVLALGLVLPNTLPAQERLLQPADLAARSLAAHALGAGLRAEAAGPGLRTAVAVAHWLLPTGSAAKARLGAALGQDDATLRLGAAALRDDLGFRPLWEAELPVGVPGFTAVDELELRHYPAYRMARTSMRGGGMGAFWPLFQHIQRHDIAMTTPVQIDYQPDGERAASMAFLYGAPELGPTGEQGRVEVVDVAAMTVLTIGSRGYDRPGRIAELKARIDAWLAAHPRWQANGELRTMGYNSPSVRDEARYFEVQVPVRRTAQNSSRTPSTTAKSISAR